MNLEKTISVVIPAFNSGKYITKTVESLLSQTCSVSEVIIVNDGSTDSTPMICDELSQKDSRVVVIHQKNQGAFAARIEGVKHAKGAWIMFVDADDSLPVDSAERLLSLIESGCEIACGTIALHSYGVYKHRISGLIDNNTYLCSLLRRETSIGPVAKLIRKDLFSKIDLIPQKEIIQNEDLLMLVALSRVAKTIYISNKDVCYNYYYNPEGVSKSKAMSIQAWGVLFQKIQNIIGELLCDENVIRAFFVYKLTSLDLCTYKKRLYLNRNNEIVAHLIQESKKIEVTFIERIKLLFLSYTFLQVIYNRVYSLLRNLKRSFFSFFCKGGQ